MAKKQKNKFSELYKLGEYVDLHSLFLYMPQEWLQTNISLLVLDGKEVSELTYQERHAVNVAIGSRNQLIIRECMKCDRIDPSWSPELRHTVERRKHPRGKRVSMSGYTFNRLIATAMLAQIEPAVVYS